MQSFYGKQHSRNRSNELKAFKSNPQEYHKIKSTIDISCGDPWMKLRHNFVSNTADNTDK